jgi:hypothetical protein
VATAVVTSASFLVIGVWSTYRPGATFPDPVLPDPSLKHVVFERLLLVHSSERLSVDGCSPLREVCSSGG